MTLEYQLTPEQRLSVAEASLRSANESLRNKTWQIASLELGLRTLRGHLMDAKDVPIAFAYFVDESLKTLDCTPEQISKLASALSNAKAKPTI